MVPEQRTVKPKDEAIWIKNIVSLGWGIMLFDLLKHSQFT